VGERDMDGRVVLVTGATSGIGRATAEALAGKGATVVIGARDAERGERVREELVQRSQNDRISVLVADLAPRRGPQELATAYRAQFERLDVLINNAGVDVGRRTTTEDGDELTLALNYLAPFALTALLLDLLRASAPARILNVVSSAHNGGNIDLDDLQSERHFGQRTYNSSKLALVLHTYELSRRLAGSGVTANCVDPGFVRGTGIGRTLPVGFKVVGMAMTPFMATAARGAATAVWAASAPELVDVTGAYFKGCRPVRSSARSHDRELAEQLWIATEDLLGPTGPT
jgi:NAD(P)-dependent dehydrogenase (short-subunit alcohol dehydrogenase family)